jgi:guanylate kinase
MPFGCTAEEFETMKNLFLVDGASATGKSDLLKWVTDNNADDVSFVVKGSTRAEREYELNDPETLLDLDFLTPSEFAAKGYDFQYTYGGARYGFYRAALTTELIARENVFLIVRNTALIEKIASEYSFINVVPLLIYTDPAELTKRLRKASHDLGVIGERVRRSTFAIDDYYANPEIYREILINNSSRIAFHHAINRLVEKYRGSPSIDPYSIAVMMSDNEGNKKLDDYYDAMETAVASVSPKYTCTRVKKVAGSREIATAFQDLITRARYIIVDLTESRPNVYYELGYAQAIGKTCLITAESGTAAHFYPSRNKIVFYSSVLDLRAKLAEELRGLLKNIPGV